MTIKERATQAFEEVEPELRDLSLWLYENPELAYQEFESSRRLAEFLGRNGFHVEFPAYGIDTAFEATAGSSGPRVVVCAEYDALPEVGHACGHNIIATSSAGAGVALAGLVDELGIRVTVLGTPAEEGGGGKIALLEGGAFTDAAASMLIHPSPIDVVDPKLLAIQGFSATFHGKEAHASAAPERGMNALDAFVLAYNNISTLRQQLGPGDRVHGFIEEGGVAANIIPALTRSSWLVRATTADELERLKDRVIACFESAATATGCRLELEWDGPSYSNLVTNSLMAGIFVANSVALGRNMPTTGELGRSDSASSDMGNVSYVVPSIHPSIAIETDSVNHQPEFAAATITPSGELALRDGALAMAHTIIDMAARDLWDRL